jgi:hypothetical protein
VDYEIDLTSNSKSMKLVFTSIFLSIISFVTLAQQPTFNWAKSIGGALTDVGLDVATDADGNSFLCGRFQGTIDADPGAGNSPITSLGDFDMYVAKFDSDGNFLWVKILGGSGYDEFNDVEVDHAGNCILAGSFEGTINPDPNSNATTITAGLFGETIILKLDPSGNTVWYHRTLGDSYTYSEGLAIDSDNAVYVAGSFQGTCDFNPDEVVDEVAMNSTFATSVGQNDAFIYKILENGSFDWVKTVGSTDFDAAKTLCIDISDRVFLGGRFRGTVDFDPNGGGQNSTSAGLNDSFVLELTTDGIYVWHATIGGTDFDEIWSIDTDNEGNLLAFGYFSGTVDLDPGIETQNFISNGSDDLFIQKFDTNGALIWVKTFGGSEFENSYGLTCDALGNIIVVGDFFNTVDFNPGTEVSNLTSAGNNDIYYLKLNSDGEFVWVIRIGATFSQAGYALTTDMNNNVLSTGTFSNTVDFNPGSEVASLFSQDFNMYLLKFEGECNLPSLNAVNANVTSICQEGVATVTIDGQLNGAETWFLTTVGCGGPAIATSEGSTIDFSPQMGESYFISSFGGCASADQQACLPVAINVYPYYATQEFFNHCHGEPFTFPDGLTFNLVGDVDYTSNLTTVNGCDSTVVTSVFVYQLPPDIDIQLNGDVLEVVNFPSKTNIDVQWVDCNADFAPIEGETNLSFLTTGVGSWALSYTDNICTQQTECITIVAVEEQVGTSVSVFPNPFENELLIRCNDELVVDIAVYSIDGKLMLSKNNHAVKSPLTLSDDFAPGIYFIQINGERSNSVVKAVKK